MLHFKSILKYLILSNLFIVQLQEMKAIWTLFYSTWRQIVSWNETVILFRFQVKPRRTKEAIVLKTLFLKVNYSYSSIKIRYSYLATPSEECSKSGGPEKKSPEKTSSMFKRTWYRNFRIKNYRVKKFPLIQIDYFCNLLIWLSYSRKILNHYSPTDITFQLNSMLFKVI